MLVEYEYSECLVIGIFKDYLKYVLILLLRR